MFYSWFVVILIIISFFLCRSHFFFYHMIYYRRLWQFPSRLAPSFPLLISCISLTHLVPLPPHLFPFFISRSSTPSPQKISPPPHFHFSLPHVLIFLPDDFVFHYSSSLHLFPHSSFITCPSFITNNIPPLLLLSYLPVSPHYLPAQPFRDARLPFSIIFLLKFAAIVNDFTVSG